MISNTSPKSVSVCVQSVKETDVGGGRRRRGRGKEGGRRRRGEG